MRVVDLDRDMRDVIPTGTTRDSEYLFERMTARTLELARERMAANPNVVLVDVREDREWSKARAKEAVHLGKGVLERDIEAAIPDHDAEVIMYCGGGYRSILTCDAARKMGYTNVHSLMGGYKALVATGWQMTEG